MINADPTICDRDPRLPLTAPFPFWLYGSDFDYVAHMMSAAMLRLSVKRIRASLGLTPISDPSGTTFEEVKFAFAAPPPAVDPPPTDLSPAPLADTRFPAIDLVEEALGGLPRSTLVVFVIRTRRVPFFHSRPSRPLLLTTIAVVLIGILLPYSPLAHVLGFRSLPWLFLVILVAMAATYLALAELGKAYFYRRLSRAATPLPSAAA